MNKKYYIKMSENGYNDNKKVSLLTFRESNIFYVMDILSLKNKYQMIQKIKNN